MVSWVPGSFSRGSLSGRRLILAQEEGTHYDRAVRDIIRTPKAPAPIGPYSQAVRAGGLVFVSGQISIDPASGQLVADDVQAQTRRVLDNVKAVLEAAGTGLDRVVRTTIFLRDIADFPKVNEVYATYFPKDPPARSTIQAGALPKGLSIEIDAIALA